MNTHKHQLKYQGIYNTIKEQLQNGLYIDGERLPTEKELADTFSVSRPTVTKALNFLKEDGLLSRKPGSGSYAIFKNYNLPKPKLFGLLIPGLGKGEIFEPICAQISTLSEKNNFSLLWNSSETDPDSVIPTIASTARRYIEHKVAGVFFAPLELRPSSDGINKTVIDIFRQADIPVILIDTDYLQFPEQSEYDLVCIDNFKSAYIVTMHFLNQGRKRIDFLARPYSAHTISLRLRGFKSALTDSEINVNKNWIHFVNPEDEEYVLNNIIKSGTENIVCGNDDTAAALMNTLEKLSIHVPEQVRIIGFDDVRYSRHLRVPLTTFKQPCQEIGNLAVETMLWRIENPGKPARTIYLPGSLIIRKSCGYSSSD